MKHRALVWFRQDLRLHDNEALTMALKMAEEVIPVYVFDDRVFLGTTRRGFRKTGVFRARFLLESVADLRDSLSTVGSNLVIRRGLPENILPELAQSLRCSWVLCNRERTQEEVSVQDVLEKKLWALGIELLYTRGKMLYHTQDFPVPVQHAPDTFTQFRKDNEVLTPIRPPLPAPISMPALPMGLEVGGIPTLTSFGHADVADDPRAALAFRGGEKEGLRRLRYYLWDTDLVTRYKVTRNGMLGGDYSTKFSPWLAAGCLSPKKVYAEIKRFERERTANESTYWVFFELLWRDYFRLLGKKFGNRIFQVEGPRGKPMHHLENRLDLFQLWAEGRTGVPFIDAHMRELNATGFMSNRGRQNVASFLVKDLKINWLLGAEYFESLLIDYDPCSNYGNWNYVAGVGSDPREDRYFNILTQARNYDPEGAYVRTWLPELQFVPREKIHRPDLLGTSDLQVLKKLNYPTSVVPIKKWAS